MGSGGLVATVSPTAHTISLHLLMSGTRGTCLQTSCICRVCRYVCSYD